MKTKAVCHLAPVASRSLRTWSSYTAAAEVRAHPTLVCTAGGSQAGAHRLAVWSTRVRTGANGRRFLWSVKCGRTTAGAARAFSSSSSSFPASDRDYRNACPAHGCRRQPAGVPPAGLTVRRTWSTSTTAWWDDPRTQLANSACSPAPIQWSRRTRICRSILVARLSWAVLQWFQWVLCHAWFPTRYTIGPMLSSVKLVPNSLRPWFAPRGSAEISWATRVLLLPAGASARPRGPPPTGQAKSTAVLRRFVRMHACSPTPIQWSPHPDMPEHFCRRDELQRFQWVPAMISHS